MKLKLWFMGALVLSAVLGLFQAIYFFRICAAPPDLDFKPDLVVVYGGNPESTHRGLDLARTFQCHLYISETTWKLGPFQQEIFKMGWRSVTIDSKALTTDQNARFAAPFIREGGYRRVALVCDWHHEPRALFLARFYLKGSGVQVEPYPNEPAPPRFWTQPVFWLQMVKLWGSMGRVVLHHFGINNWPRPQLIDT